MKRMWLLLLCVMLGVLPTTSASAQSAPPWLQVWLLRGDHLTVEYRDAAGNAHAAYRLATDMFNWPEQAGGRLFSTSLENIQVFYPYTGRITVYHTAVEGLTTDENIYVLQTIAPHPDGTAYAYGIMLHHADWEQPAASYVYFATTGAGDDRLVFEQATESISAISPLAWSDTGNILLLHEMPVGIGGYILFWTYQNVVAYDTNSGYQMPLGSTDGVSGDVGMLAELTFDEQGGPPALNTLPIRGEVAPAAYPLPPLAEEPGDGGNVMFSPSGTYIAYQVARVNPEHEKFWTVVVTVATGESRVVLEDEATGYDLRYGHIGGWLDDTTLVVGSRADASSAVIDVTSGALLREVPGVFMGYATGITDTAGFAPSAAAYVQCPGAPVSRLQPDYRGRITYTDGTMTNVRQAPTVTAAIIGSMPEGESFIAIAGPICADGYAWWNVEFDNGPIGFVAEGDASAYYLEPW